MGAGAAVAGVAVVLAGADRGEEEARVAPVVARDAQPVAAAAPADVVGTPAPGGGAVVAALAW